MHSNILRRFENIIKFCVTGLGAAQWIRHWPQKKGRIGRRWLFGPTALAAISNSFQRLPVVSRETVCPTMSESVSVRRAIEHVEISLNSTGPFSA